MGKRALVTGVTGQDGAYLSRLLLERGYEVIGAYRRTAALNLWRLEELGVADRIRFLPLELTEFTNVLRLLQQTKPTEIYNLAAQSFVGTSFEQPLYTSEVDALGVMRLLECVRVVDPSIRFYQASTSEMFGKVHETPQRETTPFHPRSPYAVAKAFAHHATVLYREAYGVHASSGILFNHESPLRGAEFVTRKITSTLALIRHGRRETLELGNLDAKRDWGYAEDYVLGMHLMLQRPKGDDYVLASGRTATVREFVDLAAAVAGLKLRWEGEGAQSRAVDERGAVRVRVNPEFFRPAEVDLLLGDAAKARETLGWKPACTLEGLVEKMMRADLDRAARGALVASV
ncbi:MAG TPA: GDP-mannose 4,6-dehydratase [Planctomycetota bacterium]|nr:GDP-mannose 4,6-dehydratase [Planctomycetota bacterium]